MSAFSAGIAFLLALAGAAFAAAVTHERLRRLTAWARWPLVLLAAVCGFLGGLLLPSLFDTATQWPLSIFGLLLLSPFLWLRLVARRDGSGAAPSPSLLARGLATARTEVDLLMAAAANVKPAPSPAPPPAPVSPPLYAFEDGDDDDADESPFAGEYQFNYEDASGDVDERVVHITHLSESKGRLYFEGWRTDTMEDRSYRVDRVVGMMVDTDTGAPYEADVLAALLGVPSTRDTAQFTPDLSAQFAPRAGWRTGVCFLGFGYAKEQELSELAEAADWKVLGDVSKHADYVVLNGRAGARQRQRAEDAGATVIDEDTFRAMV